MFNSSKLKEIRNDFPILSRKINGKPLVYLDNAATTQKPNKVIESIQNYYSKHNANVHRSIHKLSEEATKIYETSHEKTSNFIGSKKEEIIFTKNTTESINLVMYSWGMKNINKGDEIVLSQMEHHSNLVPWQQLAITKNAKLKFLEIDKTTGELLPNEAEKKITKKTKLVAICHMSNVLGTINPVENITKIAHDSNSLVLIDAAQSVPHFKVDVKKIDCDFLAFSAHKMLGPTGIGILYAKKSILEQMPPFLFGGDMISFVSYENAKWNDLPWKFEAGTPNIAGAAGLSFAVDYLNKIGMENIYSHEIELTKYALEKLQDLPKITIYGNSNVKNNKRGGVISFNLADIHPHDLSTLLDKGGIAIRGGYHCAMPLIKLLGINATSRASFYLYNTKEEIDIMIESLKKAAKIFRV